MEPTGERLIRDDYQDSAERFLILQFHLATYRFAEPYCRGKKVLDYGCGSGYGSASIAETATSVEAVDVAQEAIDYARATHSTHNIEFGRVDPRGLPFSDNQFDTVLSFQVIEHVRDADLYLSEIARVLRSDGVLVLATPDRSTRLFPMQKPWNRWHVTEYGEESLRQSVCRHFRDVDVLFMGGRSDVIGIETRRTAKLRILTIPATLPIVPDVVRVQLLSALHDFRSALSARLTRSIVARPGPRIDFGFDVDDIRIGRFERPSVNLVAVARQPNRSRF